METPDSPTPGAWLTRQMERREISVRQIADAMDVTTQTVYGWQNDKAAINEARVPRLAEVLGVAEIEARRGLGYWVPAEKEVVPPGVDREQLREALERFRRAADDLEALINQASPPPR